MQDTGDERPGSVAQAGGAGRVGVSRRDLVAGGAALVGLASASGKTAQAATGAGDLQSLSPYGNGTLPAGVRPRLVANVNGLTVNLIEAGYETPGRPMVLMLHGFPNLGYSWRKVMPALAAAGYYVVAPDCRGFGRTAGWDGAWDADPEPFLLLNMLRDQIALVYALGYRKTAMLVGHDQGQLLASYGALIRPDIFPRLTTIGNAYTAAPKFPFNTANGAPMPEPEITEAEMDAAYAQLNPPRKAYQSFWASRAAPLTTDHPPQGMHAFFRAFYYTKSADFPGNQNLHPLKPTHTAAQKAEQDAQIPEYYVMRRDRTMAQTMAAYMPDAAYIKTCKWLTEPECAVYAQEYSRTGWTGPCQEYRHRRNPSYAKATEEQRTYAGATIEVPAQVLAGRQDWGANRIVGGPEMFGKTGYTRFKGVYMIDGAGHWAHEEQPEIVGEHLVRFLRDTA